MVLNPWISFYTQSAQFISISAKYGLAIAGLIQSSLLHAWWSTGANPELLADRYVTPDFRLSVSEKLVMSSLWSLLPWVLNLVITAACTASVTALLSLSSHASERACCKEAVPGSLNYRLGSHFTQAKAKTNTSTDAWWYQFACFV